LEAESTISNRVFQFGSPGGCNGIVRANGDTVSYRRGSEGNPVFAHDTRTGSEFERLAQEVNLIQDSRAASQILAPVKRLESEVPVHDKDDATERDSNDGIEEDGELVGRIEAEILGRLSGGLVKFDGVPDREMQTPVSGPGSTVTRNGSRRNSATSIFVRGGRSRSRNSWVLQLSQAVGGQR
jgi:hypothetical protein